MKKKLLVLIFMLMLVPCLVKAEDTKRCTIVSGDGTNIGDEIACGTEHFYVLSNDGEEIKMLSKYNLYVGRTYYKLEFDQTFDNYSDARSYWNQNYSSEYAGYARFISNDDNEYYGVLAYKNIETDEVKQSSEAIGAHGNLKVEPLFPEVGVYGGFDDWEMMKDIQDVLDSESNSGGLTYGNGGYIDFEFKRESVLYGYLLDYKSYLLNNDLDIDNISILSVSEIDELVNNITNKNLPLSEWYDNDWESVNSDIYGEYYVVGRIADYLPDKYSWLWSTTYWTRTMIGSGGWDQYFVDTLGDICNGVHCNVSVGAGIRPVVTMSSDNLIYNIETKTDGNGTVVANKVQGVEGEEVEFTVEAMSGYQLKKVVVTTSTGEVLEFTDYKFTMPNTNVEIYAEFEKIENPNTGLSNPFIICGSILGIALVGSVLVKKKKYI